MIFNNYQLVLSMKVLLIFTVLLAIGSCYKGVDVNELFNLDTFQCFVRNGAQFAVVQASTDMGNTDSNVLQNLKAIKNLGLTTDIFMRVCRGKDPIQQVNDLMDNVPSNYYSNVWVYVTKNTMPGCDWSAYSEASNCAYLNSIMAAIQNRSKTPGVYSSVNDWTYALKNVNGCPAIAKFPLWYEYDDDTQSFNNFRSFGGWSQPSMKRYSVNYSWCGTESTSLNFRY